MRKTGEREADGGGECVRRERRSRPELRIASLPTSRTRGAPSTRRRNPRGRGRSECQCEPGRQRAVARDRLRRRWQPSDRRRGEPRASRGGAVPRPPPVARGPAGRARGACASAACSCRNESTGAGRTRQTISSPFSARRPRRSSPSSVAVHRPHEGRADGRRHRRRRAAHRLPEDLVELEVGDAVRLREIHRHGRRGARRPSGRSSRPGGRAPAGAKGAVSGFAANAAYIGRAPPRRTGSAAAGPGSAPSCAACRRSCTGSCRRRPRRVQGLTTNATERWASTWSGPFCASSSRTKIADSFQ